MWHSLLKEIYSHFKGESSVLWYVLWSGAGQSFYIFKGKTFLSLGGRKVSPFVSRKRGYSVLHNPSVSWNYLVLSLKGSKSVIFHPVLKVKIEGTLLNTRFHNVLIRVGELSDIIQLHPHKLASYLASLDVGTAKGNSEAGSACSILVNSWRMVSVWACRRQVTLIDFDDLGFCVMVVVVPQFLITALMVVWW